MTRNSVDEFSLISRYFGDVGRVSGVFAENSPVILGVGDDCAILRSPPDQEICLSIDTLVSGVHFPHSISAYHLGYRCLAVSVSDLAAMGAQPVAFTLALTLPDNDPVWLEGFSRGLSEAANQFAIRLIGGDTTRGPLTLSLQVHGLVPTGMAMRRSGARPGDLICVSGPLGDAGAALDFLHLENSTESTTPAIHYLLDRYFKPQPRLALGRLLREFASAAIDISDGLLADFQHIAEASQVGGVFNEVLIPLSTAIKAVAAEKALSLALSAGDDYELCFCLPEESLGQLEGDPLFDSVAVIGRVSAEAGLRMIRTDGSEQVLAPVGYQHF